MSDSQPPPVVEPARSRLALVAWERQVVGAQPALGLVGDEIARSWERSSLAHVDPGMLSAPLLADESTLASRRQLDWVEIAEQQLAPHVEAIRESGHVLTLFGADGLMLSSAGAAGTLELLHEIHFMPGAVWDERVVGTNGPGTALALHRAVHVVGAEHYCAAWHAWHCAAVPLFEPRSRRLLGALDISGRREQVSGYALGMARALGQLVEQSLLLRAEERRARVLEQFRVLVARYPADTILAADSEGSVVAAHPLPASSVALSELKRRPGTSVVTVRSGEVTVGACYIHRRDALVPSSRPKPRARPTAGALRYRLADLSGQHPLLEDARRLVRIASTNQLPVLLLGESGVGKEVAAQAVHAEGPRADGPFVAVNCGAIPKELVESELFGYVGGAFSGARRQGGRGKLEAAGGGTLFLDEIGELPLTTQVVLLRVLSEQQFTPVGGTEPRATDARIIAATNRDLQAEVAAGRFRADLFYRLNVIAIAQPPLRLRQMDLPDLCARMLARAAEETGRVVRLHPDVMTAFARYGWPGNVRELENLLKRLSAVSRTEVVELSDLPPEVAEHASSTSAGPATIPEDAHKLKLLSVISGARTMAEAAKRLGVTRSTLYRQLERLGLRPGRGVRQA